MAGARVIDRRPVFPQRREVLEPPPLPQAPPVPDPGVERETARQRIEAAREARRELRDRVRTDDAPRPHAEPPGFGEWSDLGRAIPLRALVLGLSWVGTPILVNVLHVDKEMVWALLGMATAFIGVDTIRPSGKAKRA